MPSSEVEKWISSDEIVIDAEENVFEIITRWIDHDKSERSGKFSELFSHVRLTCVSHDYLLNHVLANDLVKENADWLNSVTGALEWLDRPTDYDVPRPHPPRKALTINGIVIVDLFGDQQPCFYLPATDEWYLLPETECQRVDAKNMRVLGMVSCLGKVFIITDDVARSQCYDPDSNCWSSAPWKNMLPLSTGSSRPLVVKNRICFFEEKTGSTALWTYSLDSNSLTSLRNWVERTHFCAVAVDSFVYVISGRGRKFYHPPLKECARFDTEQSEWQKIAPLNEGRANAFGVGKNGKIFIAGGSTVRRWRIKILNTCEVYNILTDEWQFIANLTLRRTLGSMVLIDETLYVLGGSTTTRYPCPGKSSDKVECYNHEGNEWNDKATVPVNKITIRKREELRYSFKGCFLQVFKGVLTNLESVDLSG